jgi:nitroreductase
MIFKKNATELIQKRFSCRHYQNTPIENSLQHALGVSLEGLRQGPLGSAMRFKLIAASSQEQKELNGLGTYGFIKDPAGFIAGAVKNGPHALEDFGYLMEIAVLHATELGLGTCWLGGTFTRSSYAAKMELQPDELMPAVCSTGYIVENAYWLARVIRSGAQGDKRLPWEKLFFDGGFFSPLAQTSAKDYALPLEMVRLAPSASNKQPWRVIKLGQAYHFYLKRTPNYGKIPLNLIKVDDLQRVDMGIALSHFETTAQDCGLFGRWLLNPPDIPLPDALTEYTITWSCD